MSDDRVVFGWAPIPEVMHLHVGNSPIRIYSRDYVVPDSPNQPVKYALLPCAEYEALQERVADLEEACSKARSDHGWALAHVNAMRIARDEARQRIAELEERVRVQVEYERAIADVADSYLDAAPPALHDKVVRLGLRIAELEAERDALARNNKELAEWVKAEKDHSEEVTEERDAALAEVEGLRANVCENCEHVGYCPSGVNALNCDLWEAKQKREAENQRAKEGE